jgi:hypothetical protein
MLEPMISINDFNTLPFDKKCDFITVFADYLANRAEDGHKYYLYYMNGYYIEVIYIASHKKVAQIKAFASPEMVEPYLSEINIDALCL